MCENISLLTPSYVAITISIAAYLDITDIRPA